MLSGGSAVCREEVMKISVIPICKKQQPGQKKKRKEKTSSVSFTGLCGQADSN